MIVSEFLATVSDNMPSDISDGSIINWINILEDIVYSNIVGNLNTRPFISEDGLSQADRYKPDPKTLDGASIQELSLCNYGPRWIMMYEYFVYSQISLLKEEFGKANNYISLYNTLQNDFIAFYNSRYVTDRKWR